MHNQHKILRVLQLITLLRTKPAKSIRYLSGILNSTERTVYRYLDLLKDLGFHIIRDSRHRVAIEGGDENNGLCFSAEEVKHLKELVLSVGNSNKLRDSILQKLYANSDMHVQSDLLLRAHLGQIVEELSLAIQNRHQVVLKKYHSANSNDIKDRLVEPIKFSSGFQRLVAYEISTGQNKTFNIERIASVKVTKKLFKHEAHHKYSQPDVFGFSENGKHYKIELILTLRACVILKEEFPMSIPFIKPVPLRRSSGATNLYRFQTTVHDLKPVTRFVIGLLNDVEIMESKELKEHLQKEFKKIA